MCQLIVNTSAIAARTKIVTFTTGAWRAQTLHRGETANVNARNGSGKAAKVRVTLAEGGKLEEIVKHHTAAYADHKRLTMPTVQDGMRLLPAGREFEHSQTMQAHRATHDNLVSAFLSEYDDLRMTAPSRLGALYDPLKWPSPDKVARKFEFATRYLATPSDGAWNEWLAETATAAVSDFRGQLRDALQRVADRCGADGKLYDTVFSNLRDLVELSSDLNIASDPLIARISAMAAPLANNSADELRDNKPARVAAAATAQQILSYFGK